jgi:hypothetical protein
MTPCRRQITEEDVMEGGVRCPGCNTFVPFGDVAVRGACGHDDCEARLTLELVGR